MKKLALISLLFAAGIPTRNGSAADLVAVQSGTGSYVTCPTGCTGPQTGVTCAPGSFFFTYNLTFQLIDGVCGLDNPSCGTTFTAVGEFCTDNFATNATITSVVAHGAGVARCLSGGVPKQLLSTTAVGNSRFQNDTSPLQGETSLDMTANSPVNCDGFGKVNLAALGRTIEHFTTWNPTTGTSGGVAASFFSR